jgi:hypothetical protein
VQSPKQEWHKNLSDELNAFLTDDREVIDITRCRKGQMLHVVAGGHYYDIVVVHPRKKEIALVTDLEEVPEGMLWVLDGSPLRDGSIFRMHSIVVGSEMVIRALSQGILRTERVDGVSICDDAKRAQEILKRAEANRPRPKTLAQQREAERRFSEWVSNAVTGFPPDKRAEIQRLADRYHDRAAKRVALDILCQADRSGKLELAINLLDRDWDQYWCYKAPETISPYISSQNDARWKALYDELDIERSSI